MSDSAAQSCAAGRAACRDSAGADDDEPACAASRHGAMRGPRRRPRKPVDAPRPGSANRDLRRQLPAASQTSDCRLPGRFSAVQADLRGAVVRREDRERNCSLARPGLPGGSSARFRPHPGACRTHAAGFRVDGVAIAKARMIGRHDVKQVAPERRLLAGDARP